VKRTDKPWGYELLITVNRYYALKEIHMVAGTRSSLQSHRVKHETIHVLSGRIALERRRPGEATENLTFCAGESYDIEPDTIHRVTVLEDARLIEASTPELDDVVRHADDFGRAG
jgi:mannose-6-phosphate isomerase-like protein (cupin superfamily)